MYRYKLWYLSASICVKKRGVEIIALKKQVRKLLMSNLVEGYSKEFKQDYCYISPSTGTYPNQFWWDTCFHVYILCAIGEYDLAKRNMLSLFAIQEEDGFVGHILFWKKSLPQNRLDIFQSKPTVYLTRPHMSALTQPPLAAQAVLRIYEESKDMEFLRTIVPKLKKHHEWLQKKRDFDDDGLLSIITPFESGFDWKPSYDEIVGFRRRIANNELYLRVISVDARNYFHNYNLKKISKANYFIVKEVAFNVNYALDLEAMSMLCSLLGDTDTKDYTKRAKLVAKRMMEIMYDEETEAFYDVYGKRNKKSKVLTFTSFYPTALSDIPEDISKRVLRRHLLSKDEFKTRFSIPSVSINDPAFSPLEAYFLWRGPTWVVANWFSYRCLLSRKFYKEADALVISMRELIEKSGFREYYNPFTGAGYGAKGFTWSGLLLDMLQHKPKSK